MGSFFLYNKSIELDRNSVLEYYLAKGMDDYNDFELGNYKLILFKKKLIPVNNFFVEDKYEIYATGSLFYKGYNYRDSLKALLSDYKKNTINNNDLYGNYSIIFYNRKVNEIVLVVDPSFIKSVYSSTGIISSDLMAIYNSNTSNYSINELALIENIVSGCLIPPDTIFNEILRIVKGVIPELSVRFNDIKISVFYPSIDHNINDRMDALNEASKNLNKYFESVKNLCSEFGSHLGLTGGFDSRLLLVNAIKHIEKLEVNSFWRNDSEEFDNAKNLAEIANLRLFYFTDFSEYSSLNDAFYNFGGIIRSQNYWSEEFNSFAYCSRIANSNFVGFHGAGGEQYRNHEGIWRRYHIDSYLKYNWLYKQCKKSITDDKIEEELLNRIKRKIVDITHINKNRIGIAEIKKIQNEVWNVSNRTTRIDLLNQWMFYLAPFTEFQCSQSAYNYVPFLGRGGEFQKELIRILNFDLAKAKSNYGINFCEKDFIMSNVGKFLLTGLSPKVSNKIYHNFIKSKNYKRSYEEHDRSSIAFLKDKINFPILESHFITKNMIDSFDFLFKKIGK